MNYKVLKNGELLRVHSCKVYPKPYNSTEHMEYVMFNVDDREEIVIESETEIKSAVIRPLSAGISFEISLDVYKRQVFLYLWNKWYRKLRLI